MGRGAGTGAALLLVLALGGCTTAGFACAESYWHNSVLVVGSGPGLQEVADVTVCVGDTCSTASDVAADDEMREYFRTHNVGGPWLLGIGQELPDEIAVSAVDFAGRTVLDADHPVVWSGIREPNGVGCGEQADTAEVRVDFPGRPDQRSSTSRRPLPPAAPA